MYVFRSSLTTRHFEKSQSARVQVFLVQSMVKMAQKDGYSWLAKVLAVY